MKVVQYIGLRLSAISPQHYIGDYVDELRDKFTW